MVELVVRKSSVTLLQLRRSILKNSNNFKYKATWSSNEKNACH